MPTALVTGASRGVGRGVALSLAAAGYRVYATGRNVEGADLPGSVVRLPFWEQPAHRWTGMIDAGLRPAFDCSAAVPRGRGLIVNVSFWAAQK